MTLESLNDWWRAYRPFVGAVVAALLFVGLCVAAARWSDYHPSCYTHPHNASCIDGSGD